MNRDRLKPKPLSRVALALGTWLPRGYWRITKFAADRDPALWDIRLPLRSIPGMTIRADLRETVFMNFLRHGCIPGQTGHDRLFRRLVRPGDTVFDVGANVGYTMLLLSSLVGDEGKVVAFEPGRRAFASLSRNAEARGNIHLRQVAASEGAGEATFHETPMSDISSLEPVAGATEFTVPTVSLDSVASEVGMPAFIKIDVEGHEPSVLRGMVTIFAAEHPPAVLFEALTSAIRDRCIAEIRKLAPDANILRLCRQGSLTDDLDQPGTSDFLFLPEWAKARLTLDEGRHRPGNAG